MRLGAVGLLALLASCLLSFALAEPCEVTTTAAIESSFDPAVCGFSPVVEKPVLRRTQRRFRPPLSITCLT